MFHDGFNTKISLMKFELKVNALEGQNRIGNSCSKKKQNIVKLYNDSGTQIIQYYIQVVGRVQSFPKKPLELL